MAELRWEVNLGSPVVATDGKYGSVQQLILDPQQERAVALLVKRHGPPNAPVVVVPEEAMADASEREVRVRMSRDQMDALPVYHPASAVVVEGRRYEMGEAFAAGGMEVLSGQPGPGETQPGRAGSRADGSERERAGLRVRAGQRVYCWDGWAGRVTLILLGSQGKARGFVMQAGHLPGRNPIVPLAWVEVVDEGRVFLSVEKSALDGLPVYRPDGELATAVDEALRSDDFLRYTDYEQIASAVQDGIVMLQGHVETRMNRVRADEAVRSVAGVLGVDNRLVADDDLVIAVAQALGGSGLTRLERISVHAWNGFVSLTGEVSTAAVRDAAEAAAASVPQVRGVSNYLVAPGMVVDREEQRPSQPSLRGGVYAADMLLGYVERVIVDPHSRRVTAFVTRGDFPCARRPVTYFPPDDGSTQERRVVIPIRAVRHETPGSVMLKISGAEAAQYPDFDPADFVPVSASWQPPFPYPAADVLFEAHVSPVIPYQPS